MLEANTSNREKTRETAEAVALALKGVSLREAVNAVSLAMAMTFTAKHGYVARISLFDTASFPDEQQKS